MLKLASVLVFVLALSAVNADVGCAKRTVLPPLVSVDYLRNNASSLGVPLVILDVRPQAAFEAAHIVGSINSPWALPSAFVTITADGMLLEVPDDATLFANIGALGIRPNSAVVVLSAPNAGEPTSYGFSAATRVATTLIYAGIGNVAVLDGGFGAWVAAGAPTTTGAAFPAPTPTNFTGSICKSIFVDLQYVKDRVAGLPPSAYSRPYQPVRPAILIDARDVDVYFGLKTEPWAAKAGHIPTARSLPTPWLWSDAGVFKPLDTLSAMVNGVTQPFRHLKMPRFQEVIVYCGVGGYGSATWFMMTQMLGMPFVRFFDGSAQAWAATEEMTPYRWN